MRKLNVLFIDYIRAEVGGGHFMLARLVNYFQKKPSLGVKPFVYLNNLHGFINKFISEEVFVKEYVLPPQILKLNRKSSLIGIFFRTLLSIPFLFSFTIKLFRFCRKEKIDIIHANSMTALIISALPAKFAKIKLIFHLHDALLSPKQGGSIKPTVQKITLFLMRYFVDAVISVSDFVKKSVLIKDRTLTSKLYTLYNGIEVELPKFNSLANVAEDKNKLIQLLSFGRLDKTKGFQLGIETVSILKHQRHLKVAYWLLGEGNYKPELVVLANKLKVEKEVQFLGFQDDVRQWIRKADIILIPSIWQDPCPLAVIESMAEQKPVIATRVGGIPEIIEDGKSGFLVKPESAAEEMAQKIIELINNPLLKQQIAENAFKRVKENFNIEKLTTSFSQIYFTLLLKRR